MRSAKVSFRKVLGKNSLSFEELTTVLIEAEVAINARLIPDPGEPEALSPAHFLVGHKRPSRPPHRLPSKPSTSGGQLKRRWNHRKNLT